jgi:hypothetical protein
MSLRRALNRAICENKWPGFVFKWADFETELKISSGDAERVIFQYYI